MKGDGGDTDDLRAAAMIVCMMLYAAADRAFEHLRGLTIRFWWLEGETATSNNLSDACARDAIFFTERIEAGPRTANPVEEMKALEKKVRENVRMCVAQYLRAADMKRELDKVARELGPRGGRVIVGTLERPPEHWMQEYYEYEGKYRRSIG